MYALETSRIALRAIEEGDYPILLRWRNQERFLHLFSGRRNIVNSLTFLAEMKKAFEGGGRHLQFLIVRKKDQSPIGTIYSFNLDLTDGNLFVNVFIDERFERCGYGAEAVALITCYLFDHLPLHKIYFEVFAYNALSHSTMQNAGFIEEGRFKEHRFYGGQRHDVIRLAVYRNLLEERIRPFLKRVQARKTDKLDNKQRGG